MNHINVIVYLVPVCTTTGVAVQSFMLISSLPGVGESLDKAELVHIANQPTDDFMFLVDNYDSLDKIKEILAIKTCTGRRHEPLK